MQDPLRESLVELLHASAPRVQPLSHSELVIYGAGNCGRSIAAVAQDRGFHVLAFLDARGNAIDCIDGVPIFLPNSEEAKRLATSGTPVILAIHNHAIELAPILSLVRETGFARIVSYYEIHELFDLAPNFWLTRRRFYSEREQQLLAGFDLFLDETSRQIYYDAIALRLTFNTHLLAKPDLANQYLPPDLPKPAPNMRLIDGGAFNGDTLQSFLDKGIHFDAVAAFEPDPQNFRQLSAMTAKHLEQPHDVLILPCGLSSKTEMRSFNSGVGGGSALSPKGETHVQVVALDDILPNFAPSFIKLDIEGAEPHALRGAVQLIARFQPTLAVCIYHVPEHLWEIPLLLRELVPHHQLAVRYHQFNGFDVVAYAFPR